MSGRTTPAQTVFAFSMGFGLGAIFFVGAGVVADVPIVTKLALYAAIVSVLVGVAALVVARIRGEWTGLR